MAPSGLSQSSIIVVRGDSLPTQPWWPALHANINTSFANKNFAAFPPSWTRLHSDPEEGAIRLAEELGQHGLIAVVLFEDQPIACAGVLPFRGEKWIDDVDSVEHGDNPSLANEALGSSALESRPSKDWELCCVCVHPQYRYTGLSTKLISTIEETIRPLGARRLMSNYVIEETGSYWPHLRFKTIPGAGGVLKKGFTHTKGMPGLNADIHFAMGCKEI